jgi:hypothetical protein
MPFRTSRARSSFLRWSLPSPLATNSSEFLAKAWKLANDKARELGWIV